MARVIRIWPVVVLLLALGTVPAGAQTSVLDVGLGADPAGRRPVVRVQGLMEDQGLRGAVTSGLPLRIHVRVELWRKAFFDRLVEAEEASLAIVQDPLDRSYTVHNGRNAQTVATLAEADAVLRAALDFTLGPRGSGRYYYLASLNVETLSLSDLEELQRWLRGEARPAVEGRRSVWGAITQGLRRLFVRTIGLPTRSYKARSPTFVVR